MLIKQYYLWLTEISIGGAGKTESIFGCGELSLNGNASHFGTNPQPIRLLIKHKTRTIIFHLPFEWLSLSECFVGNHHSVAVFNGGYYRFHTRNHSNRPISCHLWLKTFNYIQNFEFELLQNAATVLGRMSHSHPATDWAWIARMCCFWFEYFRIW